jgi:Fe-S cluster assembly protein SufD
MADATTTGTTTARDNLAGAVETTDVVLSHLHPEGSFDLADHAVPTGLEEVWRFTPLKRLRGLHDDATLTSDAYTVTVDADPAVVAGSVGADDPAKGSSGYVPADRVSARAWADGRQGLQGRHPREAVGREADRHLVHGLDAEKAGAGHVVVTAEPFSRSTVVLDYSGPAPGSTTSRSCSATAHS